MAVCLILAACGRQTRDASGFFELSEVLVSAEVGGQLLSFDVKPGSRPVAGQTVGLIDSTRFHIRRMQLLATLHSGGSAGEMTACDSALFANAIMMQNCCIKNPLDGIVTKCYATVGAWVEPSQALYIIADRSTMLLRVYVPAEKASTLTVGQVVNVFPQLTDDTETTVTGKIVWLASQPVTPSPNEANKAPQPVWGVKIAVNNADGVLKAGQTGEVLF